MSRVEYCKCGCGQSIINQPHHKYYGIPKYLQGHNARVNHYHKGKHPSSETLKKMSESHKGICPSYETRQKLSEAMKGANHPFYGKHLSEEHRKKLSGSHGGKIWYSDNLERTRANSQRANIVRRSTAAGKLRHSMSTAMSYSLKNGKMGRKLSELLPYPIGQLKKHLEKQFELGMSWDNYGEWHIDHKVPIAAFNFKTENDLDFHRCWSLSNLQPMWAKDNFKKNDKLGIPFQPCLRFSI